MFTQTLWSALHQQLRTPLDSAFVTGVDTLPYSLTCGVALMSVRYLISRPNCHKHTTTHMATLWLPYFASPQQSLRATDHGINSQGFQVYKLWSVEQLWSFRSCQAVRVKGAPNTLKHLRRSSCLCRASVTIKTLYYPTDAQILNS